MTLLAESNLVRVWGAVAVIFAGLFLTQPRQSADAAIGSEPVL
jgi:hypothetical protein